MPHLGASAAVFDSQKILVIQRKDIETWCLPSGFVEPEETVAQAAVRETREETGLEIELTRLVGIYSAPRWRNGGDNTALFAARPTGGRLMPQEEEVLNVGFYPVDQLPEPFLWWHRQRVADAVGGIGGSVARLQGVVWPFEPGWTRTEVIEFFEKSGLTKEEFYTKHFTQRASDDGKIEVVEVRETG